MAVTYFEVGIKYINDDPLFDWETSAIKGVLIDNTATPAASIANLAAVTNQASNQVAIANRTRDEAYPFNYKGDAATYTLLNSVGKTAPKLIIFLAGASDALSFPLFMFDLPGTAPPLDGGTITVNPNGAVAGNGIYFEAVGVNV